MSRHRAPANSIVLRCRTLQAPWLEIIREIRAERGALLGSGEFKEMAGVEQASALDTLDTRLRTAEDWVLHYETQKDDHTGPGLRRQIAIASRFTDEELGV